MIDKGLWGLIPGLRTRYPVRQTMVLVLDGNSEIGAHVRSNFLLFDLFKAFSEIESSQKSYPFLSKYLFTIKHIMRYHLI